jgi:hypothetical protein
MADHGAIGSYYGTHPLPSPNNAGINHNLDVEVPATLNPKLDGCGCAVMDDERTVRSIAGIGAPGMLLAYDPSTQTYIVSGTVKVNNTLMAGYTVRMFRRDNGALLAEAKTDLAGNFTLTTVAYSGLVSIIAYDQLGAQALNALIYDQVTPV